MDIRGSYEYPRKLWAAEIYVTAEVMDRRKFRYFLAAEIMDRGKFRERKFCTLGYAMIKSYSSGIASG